MFNRYLSSRLIPLPHILTIEITSYCNLECVMCPRTAGFVNTPSNRVISMDIIERLDPILGWINGVDLSGLWGEAFLHPELYLEILERLKRRHIGVRTVSNGTLITEKLAERLVVLKLDSVDISVDAARGETYRKIRRGGELEQVVNGITAINRFKKKHGSSFPEIKLLFLGLTDNIEELPEFVRLAHSLSVNRVMLQAMGEYEAVRGKSIALRHKKLGLRWLREAEKRARELGVRMELFPPDQFQEEDLPSDEALRGRKPQQVKMQRRTKDCFFPWDRAVITTGGDLLPCCAAPSPFGNLMEQSFKEIWYGEAYTHLRRSLLEGQLPPMCASCTGQGWRTASRSDTVRYLSTLEGIRVKQRLRRSPALRKVKNFVLRH
jgi:MoaA/NifB/PqqE/SkfB family radical SAM enzyme